MAGELLQGLVLSEVDRVLCLVRGEVYKARVDLYTPISELKIAED